MFKPFDIFIWISILLIIIITTLTLKLILKLEKHDTSIVHTFILSVGAFCQQGVHHRMSLCSIRLYVFSLLIAGLLIYNFYTSVLVSTIIDVRFDSNINSKDDLVRNNIPMAFQNSTIMRSFLNVSI